MSEALSKAELRRIAEEFKTERDAAKRDAMRAFDERNILLVENAALRADAARYRWVRGQDDVPTWVLRMAPKALDAAIDSAMSKR